MTTITPCLWFDDQAESSATFYGSVFDDAQVGTVTAYPDTGQEIHGHEAGSVMTVEFQIENLPFIGLNGGPQFTFTPAISLFVSRDTESAVDALYDSLVEDGEVLMPLQSYPFSERYAWIQDRYGLSWQLFYDQTGSNGIAPCLLFVGDQAGNAEAAIESYTALFPDSAIEDISRYGSDETPDIEGTVKHAIFNLGGQEFRAMDSNHDHQFSFTEAISLHADCETQAEIDRYWERLSADPAAERCGWLKDEFGVSWQIVPTILTKLLRDPDPEKVERVTEAYLQMGKFDIEELRRAGGIGS